MCNNTSRINDYIVDEQIDVALLTETWLSGCEMDFKNIADVTPSGYKLRHKVRTYKKDGGVWVMYRDGIRLETHSAIKASVHIIIVYRLHLAKKSKIKSSDFFA